MQKVKLICTNCGKEVSYVYTEDTVFQRNYWTVLNGGWDIEFTDDEEILETIAAVVVHTDETSCRFYPDVHDDAKDVVERAIRVVEE